MYEKKAEYSTGNSTKPVFGIYFLSNIFVCKTKLFFVSRIFEGKRKGRDLNIDWQ